MNKKTLLGLPGSTLVAMLVLTSPVAQAEGGSLGEVAKGLGSIFSEITSAPVPRPDPRFQFARDGLRRLHSDEYISFSPANPKAHIYVFADVNCPYTRLLHRKVPEFNAKGIEVRYVASPSGERNEPAWTVYRNIWCSDNPKQAFDDVVKGRSIPAQICSKNELRTLDAQYDVRLFLNIAVTPTIFFQDGYWNVGWEPGSKEADELPGRAILGAKMVSTYR